jgi:hypothetical protein
LTNAHTFCNRPGEPTWKTDCSTIDDPGNIFESGNYAAAYRGMPASKRAMLVKDRSVRPAAQSEMGEWQQQGSESTGGAKAFALP